MNRAKPIKNLTKTEIKNLIENNIYNADKKDIALRYYVYEECMIDIAIEYNLDRHTVSHILKNIFNELEEIA